jgi:hypothetical protein
LNVHIMNSSAAPPRCGDSVFRKKHNDFLFWLPSERLHNQVM